MPSTHTSDAACAARSASVSLGLSRKQQAAEEQQSGLMVDKLAGNAAAGGLFPDDGMPAMPSTDSLAAYKRRTPAAAKPDAAKANAAEKPTKLSPAEILKKLAEQ